MNYPFMYQVIGRIDVEKVRESLVQVADEAYPFNVKDLSLKLVKSAYIEDYLKDKFGSFELYGGHALLSRATSCPFHHDLGTDKDLIYTVTHRVIICLSENYYYEWDYKGERTVYRPKIGDVILFNNLELHRFIMDEGSPAYRETIMLNLVDKNLLPLIKGLT